MPVPDLVGLGALSARQAAHEVGLLAERSDPDGSPLTHGFVVRQDPPPGTGLARGSIVTVWTDPPGPPLREVPDLIGLSGHAAVDAGRAAGLIAILDPEGPAGPDDLSGVVTDQRPVPGTRLAWARSSGCRWTTCPAAADRPATASRATPGLRRGNSRAKPASSRVPRGR